MSAVTLLCEIMAQGAKASAETFRLRTGYGELVQSGLLQEAGIVQSVPCGECDESHDAEVLFLEGRYGFICPEHGFVPVADASISGIEPDSKELVTRLADAFECKRRKTTPVHGKTWRIGAMQTPAGDVVIYFHPRLQGEQDARDIEAALLCEIKSRFRLILTADGALPFPGGKTARLDEVVDLDRGTGAMIAISDPCAIVGAQRVSKGGRPNQFENKLSALILERTQEGIALTGLNAEARAILHAYQNQHSGGRLPSLPTIKRYLVKARDGF